jgi:hypothetical protein
VIARRYYIHRALRVYHTEGTDRVSMLANRASVVERVRVFCAVGEDRVYLKALRAVSPRRYLRILIRVWVARLLRPILMRPGVR